MVRFKAGIIDVQFAERISAYLGHLKAEGLIESWRLTRRKLSPGASVLSEFHINDRSDRTCPTR